MLDEKPKSDEWVSLVAERIKQAEDWTIIRQILVNLNYYIGNQWIIWDPTRRTVTEAPREPNQERITHNIIKPRVLTKLAKQTKNRIKYDVMPDTNSQERIEVAKGATKFIHFWWQEEEMDRKTRDIFLNNNVKGYCAAKVYLDAKAGSDITPNEGEEGFEEGKKVMTGEIRCRICDPLTLFIDPAATSDDEIRWMVERKPKDVDYIEEEYGVKVTPDENINFLGNYDMSAGSTGLTTHLQKKNKNMAMLDEMWVAPCPKYPNGLKVTVAGGQRLDYDENAGEIPYIIFGDIPIPGKVTYDAYIKDMLPTQRNMNIALSMMATNFKRMGNSLWLIPIGSGVDEDELVDEIGGFVHYNPANGMKPERAEAPNLPNAFDRIIEYYNRIIDDMSGAREITQGRLPAGLDTASGLALMVEQENEKLAVTSLNYERGMKKLLQRVLMLMKKHYTEERLGRILGEDNEIELVSFTGADLSGGEDINIVQGSSLPEMKSAQQDRIMSLWSAGAITKKDGSPDAETLLRLMGMGDSTELFEQHQLDENKAKMENKLFAQMMQNPELLQVYMGYQQQKQMADAVNQELQMQAENQGLAPDAVQEMMQQPPEPPKGIPLVRDFQDHEVHIYNHRNFQKSHEYDELPYQLQSLVDAHVAEHEQLLQAQMIAQQQAQVTMQQQQAEQESNKALAEQERTQAHQTQMKQMDHQNNLEKTALQGALSGQG